MCELSFVNLADVLNRHANHQLPLCRGRSELLHGCFAGDWEIKFLHRRHIVNDIGVQSVVRWRHCNSFPEVRRGRLECSLELL